MNTPSAPTGVYPALGAPYHNNNEQEQALYPQDTRPVFGATQPLQTQGYSMNMGQSFPQQGGGSFPSQVQGPGFQPQPGVFPPQGPGFPPQTRVFAPQQTMRYQGQPGFYPQDRGYPQPRGYPPQGVRYPQPQGYSQPGLYTSSSGNTDTAMAAGLGALAGLAGTYFADDTPTMGEMVLGAGVGGAVGLAGSAATSNTAMSALGLAGHDMGDMKARRNARTAARYGIPVAAMGTAYLVNKASIPSMFNKFDRRSRSGYDSE